MPLPGFTNFIANAICVVPYIELSFPKYTGSDFKTIGDVQVHWDGQLKQLLRETGNCEGSVFVEDDPYFHVTLSSKPKK